MENNIPDIMHICTRNRNEADSRFHPIHYATPSKGDNTEKYIKADKIKEILYEVEDHKTAFEGILKIQELLNESKRNL